MYVDRFCGIVSVNGDEIDLEYVHSYIKMKIHQSFWLGFRGRAVVTFGTLQDLYNKLCFFATVSVLVLSSIHKETL